MFSAFRGSSSTSNDATTQQATNGEVHTPHERLTSPDSTFGPLTSLDNSWACLGGFATETQTFYAMTPGKDAKLILCQVIHSGVGMWYPQITFNFRLFDPAADRREWRSTNVTGFTTPAPAKGDVKFDKRSSKSEQFSITLDPSKPDCYSVEGKYDANTDISLKFKRTEGAPGFKLGSGPKGGMTYFGAEKSSAGAGKEGPDYTSGTDGFVIHRFWPRCTVSGIIRIGKEVISLDAGARGLYIHAIQGMRPNLVACRWNFGYFNSSDEKEGVSLMMMDFTTTSSYGNQKVTVGSVVVDDRLVAVVADGTVEHLESEPIDSDTGYPAPGKIQWTWPTSRSLLPYGGEGNSPAHNTVQAEILLDLQPSASSSSSIAASSSSTGGSAEGRQFRGLIEKVDVLAQIPYLVKKVISYVAGTKPYIYQFHNNTTAKITIPSNDGTEVRNLSVEGSMFNEATFISPH